MIDLDFPEEFDKLFVDEQQNILAWIKNNLTAIKSFNPRWNSANLKKLYETDSSSYI